MNLIEGRPQFFVSGVAQAPGLNPTTILPGQALSNFYSQFASPNKIDNLQIFLDGAGIADPTPTTDLANAAIYAARGKYGNAAVSAVSATPYLGDLVAKGGKYATLGLLAFVKGSNSVNKVITFTEKQLQKKFKHAADFGIQGNYNKKNAQLFKNAIAQHINNANVKTISGTYRGNPVNFFVDPSTGLNVLTTDTGKFISGWKLSSEQLNDVLTKGFLW